MSPCPPYPSCTPFPLPRRSLFFFFFFFFVAFMVLFLCSPNNNLTVVPLHERSISTGDENRKTIRESCWNVADSWHMEQDTAVSSDRLAGSRTLTLRRDENLSHRSSPYSARSLPFALGPLATMPESELNSLTRPGPESAAAMSRGAVPIGASVELDGAFAIGSKADIAPNPLGRYAVDVAVLVGICGRGVPCR